MMKGADISARMLWFAGEVIRLCRTLPDEAAAKVIARQLLRSGTSVGSNYEEARSSESRADFIHKISIALKELRETHYWLMLAKETELLSGPTIAAAVSEANELLAILTASIRTAKARAAASQAKTDH